MLSQNAGISFWNSSLVVGVTHHSALWKLKILNSVGRMEIATKVITRIRFCFWLFSLLYARLRKGAIRNRPMYISMYHE